MNQPTMKSNENIGNIPAKHLNIMGYVDESQVNGPGTRAVVWIQGCKRECDGCFNPASWSFEINQLISVDDLANKILSHPKNQGVTFSGGEPFFQAKSLAEVARKVKGAGLTVMSFSGFTLKELQSDKAPEGSQELLDQLDILVDGPFVKSLAIHSTESLVSSRNQQVHIFNPALQNELSWASDEIEIHVLKDGSYIITGYQGQMDLQEKLNSN
jgi:anaerobic ribonucleoside-triphosphate reductase activating protein